MINSAIIEDLNDNNQRYMYISFGTHCIRYSWLSSLLDVMPCVAYLDGTSDANTFLHWLQYTNIKYNIISVFANDDFTGELRIDDYPELLI